MIKITPLTKHGQLNVGDVILIKRKGIYVAPVEVKQICFKGTEKEEIVISKKHNKYFILSKFLSGNSWVEECCILENGRLYSVGNSMRGIDGAYT